MAPATPRVPLGATTNNRKWWLDVEGPAATAEVPEWIGVYGITEFQDSKEQTLQDDSDFDSEGWKSQITTALAAAVSFKVKRAVTAGTKTYDPGQEILREASDLTGVENEVLVRFYEMEPNGPRVEAYELRVTVGWSPDGGGMDALSTVSVTLTGRGRRTPIEHPAAAA